MSFLSQLIHVTSRSAAAGDVGTFPPGLHREVQILHPFAAPKNIWTVCRREKDPITKISGWDPYNIPICFDLAKHPDLKGLNDC